MENTISKRTYNMTFISLFTVIITICSWISIPTAVPFTMQTFAIFLALSILGGKKGTISVLIYCALGLIGLPVFANFTGGVSAFVSKTGGYIVGFILSGLVYWAIVKIMGEKLWIKALAMVLGLIACYTLGTIWFMVMYINTTGNIGIYTVLSFCVIPFIIPDILKIVLALLVSERVKKYGKH